jgi:hypothetical protein
MHCTGIDLETPGSETQAKEYARILAKFREPIGKELCPVFFVAKFPHGPTPHRKVTSIICMGFSIALRITCGPHVMASRRLNIGATTSAIGA